MLPGKGVRRAVATWFWGFHDSIPAIVVTLLMLSFLVSPSSPASISRIHAHVGGFQGGGDRRAGTGLGIDTARMQTVGDADSVQINESDEEVSRSALHSSHSACQRR